MPANPEVITTPPASAVAPEPGEIQIMPDEAPATAVGNMSLEDFTKALGMTEIVKEGQEEPATDTAPAAVPELDESEVEGDVIEGTPVDTAPPADQPPEGSEPERQLATQFAVYDTEGELEIPELYVNFKANNKEYEKVPLDKVVRLAQMGVYQHDREMQVHQKLQQAAQIQQTAQQLQARVQEMEGFYDRVFRDPSFYDEAQQLYLAQQSPESRAARAEAAERNAREQLARQHEERYAATFVQQQLSPALEQLVQRNPLVDAREVFGQFSYLTAPLLDRGRVPAGRLNVVAQLVQTELVPWVERLQATRAVERQTQDTQVAQAKQQAALAKRHLARRAGSPPGTAPGSPNDRPKEFESVHDWLNADMGGSLR